MTPTVSTCGHGVPTEHDIVRGDPIVKIFSEGSPWVRVHNSDYTGDSFNPVIRKPEEKEGGRFDSVALPRSCWLRVSHGDDSHHYAYCGTDVVDCLTEVFGRLIYDRPGPRLRSMSASRFTSHSASQVEITKDITALDFAGVGQNWVEIIPMCDFATTHDYETSRLWGAWLRLKAFPGYRAMRYVTRLCLNEALVLYSPIGSSTSSSASSPPQLKALATWKLSSPRGVRNLRRFAHRHQITITRWRGIR